MPENSSGTSKLIWMVIGAVVTGLIGIPVSYVVGILSPSAHLGISVATHDDLSLFVDQQYRTLQHPLIVTIVVSNASNFLSAKQTTIRAHISVFGNLFAKGNLIRTQFYNAKIAGDPACKETARQFSDGGLCTTVRCV